MEAVSILININGTKKLRPCSHTYFPRISGSFADPDPGSGMEKIRIRDPGRKKLLDPRSGINIPDPQH